MKKGFILLPIILSLVFFGASLAQAHNNSSPNGVCFECHKVNGAPATLEVSGMPDKYTPGGVYDVTVTVKSANESFGEVEGGFSAKASAGEIIVTDDMNTQISEPYLTHTKEGSEMRTWKFKWKAPTQKTTAELHIMAVAANGDFAPAGDSIAVSVAEVEPK